MRLPEATPRIRFRPYSAEDCDRVLELFSDSHARRFYPQMSDLASAESWIRWNLENYESHGFGLWVIEHRESGEFLGDCGLTYQRADGEQVLEIGYHLTDRHRGKGYATEAAVACRDHALDVLNANEVCSLVDPGNTASRAVAGRVHGRQRTATNVSGEEIALYWSIRGL